MKAKHLYLACVEFVEYVMRVVSAVIVTHSCVIAPDYKVCAAVILAYYSVKNGFARPRITHRGRVYSQ